jgi:hypothetical protein
LTQDRVGGLLHRQILPKYRPMAQEGWEGLTQTSLVAEFRGGLTSGIQIAPSRTGSHLSGGNRPMGPEPLYTTKREGLGMGLAIVRTIVNAHGGGVGAENNPEGGASFRVTPPVALGKAR